MSTPKHTPRACSQSFSFASTFTPSPARPFSSQSSWLASNDQAATRRPSASERGAVGEKRRAESATILSERRTQTPERGPSAQSWNPRPRAGGQRRDPGAGARAPAGTCSLPRSRRCSSSAGSAVVTAPRQHPPRCPIWPPGASPLLQAPQPRQPSASQVGAPRPSPVNVQVCLDPHSAHGMAGLLRGQNSWQRALGQGWQQTQKGNPGF